MTENTSSTLDQQREPLTQITDGDEIHHGDYSRVYEVVDHPELILKRSTNGLMPDEIANIFPDAYKQVEAGATLVPLDIDTVFPITPDHAASMTQYAHIPEFYSKQGVYRAFAEGVALHRIAAQIPEARDHVTGIHSMYLQKMHDKYHITLLLDKVLKNEGEEERARNLHSVIDEIKILPVAERLIRVKQLLGHLRDVAQTLDILAQADPSIKHRDISAGNLLLQNEETDKEKLVIADFGLVLFGDQTLKREGMGTFFFMAPEMLEDSSQARPESDQYSLGIIVGYLLGVIKSYTMLSTDQSIPKVDRNFWDIKKDDKHPFIARGYLIRELCHIWGDRRTHDFETVMANVADVLIKGGDREPEERYDSCTEMMDELIGAFAPLAAT